MTAPSMAAAPTGRHVILRGDARALPLADASIDLVVTSPPYYGLRSYQDGGRHYDGQIGAERSPAAYVDSLIESTREMVRILKPTGSIWVNLGDSYYSGKGAPGRNTVDPKNAGRNSRREGTSPLDTAGLGLPRKSLVGIPWRYAIRCIDELGLTLRAEVVWSKPNGLPESVDDRVRRSHETWFHFVQQPRYYAAMDEIREPSDLRNVRPQDRRGEQSAKDSARRRNGHAVVGHPGRTLEFNLAGKLPGSVWEIATQPLRVPDELGVQHFAAFPMEWPRRLVRAWCPQGGVVLDPFGGTGTTALVASVLGRAAISIDGSADYCRLARWRCTDSVERARAAQVDKPPVEVPGQGALFGEAS